MVTAEEAAKKDDDSPSGDEKPDIEAQMNDLRTQMGELVAIMSKAFANKADDGPPAPPAKEEKKPEEEEKKPEGDEGEMGRMRTEFARMKKEIENLRGSAPNHDGARGTPGSAPPPGNGKFNPATFDWPSYMLSELGQERGLLRRNADGKFVGAGAWEEY